tara:strand:+ start:178 stop:600 length:423 start_codon:yes stop_codon:yes gene_type:complete
LGIRVTIKNNTSKRINKVLKQYASKQNQWVDTVGSYFRNQIALEMTISPPSGNVYREGTPTEHIASSVGNAPRVDTGVLRSSIQYKRLRGESGVGLVSTNIEYAERLEKQLKRPFMGKNSKAYMNTLIFGKMVAKNLGIK